MNRLLLALSFAFLAIPADAQQPLPASPRIALEEGANVVTMPDYVARIDADGMLASFKVHGVETLGEPFDFQRSAKMTVEKSEPIKNGLRYTLKGPGGSGVVDYTFRLEGLTVTPTWHGGLYSVSFTTSAGLQGFELLRSNAPGDGEILRFSETGATRGVPAFPSSRNQMVRWHFADFALHAYVQRWGAPFNIEGLGSISGRRWSTDQLSGNQPFPIVFTIEKNAPFALPAVAFAPRSGKAMSLFYRDEPCTWSLDFGAKANTDALRAAGINDLGVTWTLTDINGKPAGEGKATASLTATADTVAVPVTITTPGSGWYQVTFRLTDAGGKMRPSEFDTRFTVINRVPGAPPRLDEFAAAPADDYATVAMIGLGNVRESHPLGNYIRNTAPPANDTAWTPVADANPPAWINFKYLDEVWTRAATESKKRGVGWFFQWNSRPGWATPQVFEAIAYAMVSRGKDRVRVWECENEPNGGYSAKDYLEKAVIPFWKGAKRADPTAQIMGPGCVGIKPTLEFMDVIYKLGGGKYFDQISTHSYPGPGESWEQFGNPVTLGRLRKLMADNGDGKKVLWQTEQGYSWDMNPKNQVARYVVRQFLQGARLGIAPSRQYYFYPKAHGFQPWYQAGGGEEGSRDSWLPLAAAQRFAAENLAGTTYLKDEKSPYKGLYFARFTGAAEDVIAAWTFDFTTAASVAIPGLKRAVDWNGNEIKLAREAGGRLTLPLSGEPLYIHLAKGSPFDAGAPWGRNLAAQWAGATAGASSFASETGGNDGGASGRAGNGPAAANDGNWNLWEPALDLPGRTAWRAADIATPDHPEWLQIDFPVARTIDRIMALGYIPAVNPTARDWQLQAWQNGDWKTLAEAKDWRSWNLYAHFAPVTTEKIRLHITGVNDGWMLDHRWMAINRGPDAPSYTGEKVLISELEAYGPEVPVRVAAEVTTTGLLVRVLNTAGKPFSGTLTPRLPAGYAARPAVASVTLAANDKEKSVRFAIEAPHEVPTGSFAVGALLNDAAGHPVDVATDKLDVAAPLEIGLRSPVNEETGTRLVVNLHNVTTAAQEGTVEVSGAALEKPISLPFKAAPGEAPDISFPVPGLSLAGKTTDFVYTVRAANTITAQSQRVRVLGWHVAGPFPNDFEKAFGPENDGAAPDIKNPVALPDGKTARWQLAADEPDGMIQLLGRFGRNDNASAYATITFDSPVARRAILSLGSDDGVRVWLNGQDVWDNNAGRGAAPGEDKVPVQIAAGRNTVLLKITQGGGGWGFYFDILDATTKKSLEDLIYKAAQP